MKRTIIILIFIIVVFGGILFYKIENSKKEFINLQMSEKNTNNVNIESDVAEITKNDNLQNAKIKNNISSSKNTTIAEEKKQPTNTTSIIVNTTKKKTTSQPNENTKKDSTTSTHKATTSDTIKNTITNSIKTEDASNKEESTTMYASLGTYKIINKFTGYNYNNIYILSNGLAYIQTDYTLEFSDKGNQTAELRILSNSDSTYGLYVSGMNKYVEIDMMNTFKSYTVFPQKEYSYYKSKLEEASARGVLNSSSTKPYFEKIEEIKNNWTHLGYGRVIGLGNFTYWKQISSHTDTFLPNAETYRITYNNKNYLYIDGINDFIEVEKYE